MARLPRPSPLRQIRKFCIDCCGESPKAIQFCCSLDCALWYLRFGKYPTAYVKLSGNKFKGLFDQSNFKSGKKYDPEQEVEDIRL